MAQLDLAWPSHPGDGSPEPQPSPAGLSLIMPGVRSIWLGQDPGGALGTARRLAELPDPADVPDPAAEAATLTERASALASLRTPTLVPVLGVQLVDRTLWLVSEADHDLGLGRLLELTRLTPTQALVVGCAVACGVWALHDAGYAHGDVSAAEVRVGGDGQVRLDGWAAGVLLGSAEPLDGRQRTDLAALGGLLSTLAGAARSSVPATEESALTLLAALDTAAGYAALPGTGAELVTGPLQAACGPAQDAAGRSELAALVAAITGNGRASGWRLPPTDAAPATSSARSASSPSQDLSGESWVARLGTGLRSGWQRAWTWVVALVVLVGVVSLEFVLLHDRLTQDVQLLLGGQPGTGSRSGPTSVALPPVPAPAPVSAGPVNGVDLRALEPCTPGAACMVRVLVRLQPQPQPQAVA
ncbi:MAG TPA: hypothetical protein VFQ77_22620 [Pseudonocardiaceae bacterium]|nr:hypothetical protein [Pseudonocardiaceae bacterium]